MSGHFRSRRKQTLTSHNIRVNSGDVFRIFWLNFLAISPLFSAGTKQVSIRHMRFASWVFSLNRGVVECYYTQKCYHA